MKKPKLSRLNSFRLRNFKAVHDSRVVRLDGLTVLIGNNGSGKSSLIEGLQAFKTLVSLGIDGAFQQWRGIENIRHKGVANRYIQSDQDELNSTQPIRLGLIWRKSQSDVDATPRMLVDP